jgi:hypothetical protein
MQGLESYSLWVEKAPSHLRVDSLCLRLFGNDKYAPYLFVIFVAIIDVPLLSTIGYIIHNGRTVHPLIDYGWWILVPIGLILGVHGINRIREKYSDATSNVGRTNSNLQVPTAKYFRISIYILSLTAYGIFIVPNLPQFLSTEGQVIGVIKWLFIIPFFYLPIISEFFVVYLHGLFFVSISISRQNVPLDFSDPSKLGGMGNVGDLIISSTSLYFVGLALWTGTTIIGPITGIRATPTGPGTYSIGFFIISWTTGVFLFLLSLWIIHRHMYKKKQNEINEIVEEIRLSGYDDEVFPYTNPNDSSESLEYIQKYINLQRVEETKTYPINVNKIWEFSASAILPIFLQTISLLL